jgi:hypothetical protein
VSKVKTDITMIYLPTGASRIGLKRKRKHQAQAPPAGDGSKSVS